MEFSTRLFYVTFLSFFMMLAGSVMAGPVITSASGGQDEGATVYLQGSGFGAFNGVIVSWDDFETQTVGNTILGSPAKIGGKWTTQFAYDGMGARWGNDKSHSGSKSARIDWSIDKDTIRAFGWDGRGPYNKLFISYWRYMEGNYNHQDSPADNHKQFYLFGNNGQFPQLMPFIPGGNTTWGIYNNVGDSSVSWSERNNINTAGWSYNNTKDKFQRWDFWFKLNDVDVPNGTVQAWVDGVKGIENFAYNTRRVNGEFVDFRLGHMAQGFNDTAKAWFDDLYIATTQARVELCDSAIWSGCTHREIQIVDTASWSNGQVQFQLRRGGFASLSGKYVYVVDDAGNVNESGFPLSGESLSPPMPPIL